MSVKRTRVRLKSAKYLSRRDRRLERVVMALAAKPGRPVHRRSWRIPDDSRRQLRVRAWTIKRLARFLSRRFDFDKRAIRLALRRLEPVVGSSLSNLCWICIVFSPQSGYGIVRYEQLGLACENGWQPVHIKRCACGRSRLPEGLHRYFRTLIEKI